MCSQFPEHRHGSQGLLSLADKGKGADLNVAFGAVEAANPKGKMGGPALGKGDNERQALGQDGGALGVCRGEYGRPFAGGHLPGLIEAATKYRVPLQTSMDGNTVELSQEQTAFAENAVQYQTTLSFLNGRIGQITRALKGE